MNTTRARLRDAEKAADNARRMKEFGYRWLAFSGAVKPCPKRVNWNRFYREWPVVLFVALVLTVGWVAI